MHLICAKSIKWGNWNSINRFTYKNHFSLHTLFCIKYRFNRWELGEWCVTYCNNRIYVKLVSFIVKFKIKKLKLNQKRKKKIPCFIVTQCQGLAIGQVPVIYSQTTFTKLCMKSHMWSLIHLFLSVHPWFFPPFFLIHIELFFLYIIN